MPSIPTYDSLQVAPQGLNSPRESYVGSDAFTTQGRQQQQLGNTLTRAGDHLGDIAVKRQERENADRLFQAEATVTTEYLEFEKAARERRGENAKGLTKEAGEWWDKKIGEHSQNLDNDVQKKLFAQSATKRKLQSLDSFSNYEVGESHRSLVESANASIVSMTNFAAAHANEWASPLYKASETPQGLVAQGNIDLSRRPKVKNADGSVSTVRSMGVNIDGEEVLIPTVVNGKVVSDKEAIDHYRKTGEHLGKFASPEAATAYAEQLHQQQERMYVNGAPFDPIAAAKRDVINRVAVLAQINGWAPEMRELKEQEALTNLHLQVLQGMSKADPDKAGEYFKLNKGEINGGQHDSIEQMLEQSSNIKTAQTFADTTIGAGVPLEEAIGLAREKYSGRQEEEVVQALKERSGEQIQARRQRESDSYERGLNAFSSRMRLSDVPADLRTSMGAANWRRITEHARNAASGESVKTDFATWYDLRQRITGGEQVNLLEYINRIAPGDLKDLARLKTDPGEARDAATLDGQLSNTHDLLGWKGSDAEKKGKFDIAVTQAINTEQQRLGKKLNFDERQKVIDRMLLEGKVPGLIWGSGKHVFEVQGTEDAARFVPTIPATERAKIESALTRRGIPVTDSAVMQLYKQKAGL